MKLFYNQETRINDECMCFEGNWRLTGNFYKQTVREKLTEKESTSHWVSFEI